MIRTLWRQLQSGLWCYIQPALQRIVTFFCTKLTHNPIIFHVQTRCSRVADVPDSNFDRYVPLIDETKTAWNNRHSVRVSILETQMIILKPFRHESWNQEAKICMLLTCMKSKRTMFAHGCAIPTKCDFSELSRAETDVAFFFTKIQSTRPVFHLP